MLYVQFYDNFSFHELSAAGAKLRKIVKGVPSSTFPTKINWLAARKSNLPTESQMP